MSFKTDIADDIANTIYDLDEFADSAVFTPKLFNFLQDSFGFTIQDSSGNTIEDSGGATNVIFACFIGDNVMHGNSYTEDVEEELIEMSTPTSNVTGIKEFDTITANGIDYEVAGPAVLDSPTSNIAFVTLRRSLNNQTRI